MPKRRKATARQENPARPEPAPDRLPARLAAAPGWLHWLLGLGAPAVLILWRVGLGGMLAGSDVELNFHYVRAMVAGALATGSLPVWDPHTLAGFPHLAALQGAVFYPLNWVFMLCAPGWAWTLTVLLHLWLAYAFAFLWLRHGCRGDRAPAALGALVFAWSGYLLLHVYAGHIAMISAYCWTPALLWLFERFLASRRWRYWAGFAAALALQIVTGYPELVFFSALVLLARGLHHLAVGDGALRQRLWQLALLAVAGLLGVALAAPQLLPTLELVRATTRSAGATAEFATSFSLPPENCYTLLAPGLLGDLAQTPYLGRWFLWECCAFVGLTSLVLAFAAVLDRWAADPAEHRPLTTEPCACGRRPQLILWLCLLLAGYALALGRYAPFFPFCHAYLPGFSFFRAPGRYLFICTLAAAWLAAAGLARVSAADAAAERLRRRCGWLSLSGAALLLGILFLAHSPDGGRSIFWRHLVAMLLLLGDHLTAIRADDRLLLASCRTAEQALFVATLTLAGIGGALLLAARRQRLLPFLRPALVLFAALELAFFGARYLRPVPEARQQWPAELAARLKETAGGYRVTSVGDSRDIGRAQLYGVDHAGGNDPLLLRHYAEAVNVWEGRPADDELVIAEPVGPGPLRRLLGIRYCVVQPDLPPPKGFALAGRYGDFRLFENPDVLPRVFFVPAAKVVENRDERLRILTSPGFDPAKLVLLEAPAPALDHPAPPDAKAEVKVIERRPGYYRVQVNAPGDGFLVLAENHYPGWTATVTPQPASAAKSPSTTARGSAPSLRADHFLQAVRLDQGACEVEFAYRSAPLHRGLLLAALAAGLLALPAGFLLLGALRRRRQRRQA